VVHSGRLPLRAPVRRISKDLGGDPLVPAVAPHQPAHVRPVCASLTLPDEGRGREPAGSGGLPYRPPKVKGLREQPESLRQRDRELEGVLESPAWTGADGVTLSGLGQGGKSNAHPRQGV
jgi:hypothetical protein